MMTGYVLKLKRYMGRVIRGDLGQPYNHVTQSDVEQNIQRVVTRFHELENELFKITCDYTNNNEKDLKEGRVTLTIQLKADPQ